MKNLQAMSDVLAALDEWERAYAASTERQRVIDAVTERLKPKVDIASHYLDALRYSVGVDIAKRNDFGVIMTSTC